MTNYTIFWGHSGRQGKDWNTAREASEYAAEVWGEVEAHDAAHAIELARAEGLDVAGWYEEKNVIHVIPTSPDQNGDDL